MGPRLRGDDKEWVPASVGMTMVYEPFLLSTVCLLLSLNRSHDL